MPSVRRSSREERFARMYRYFFDTPEIQQLPLPQRLYAVASPSKVEPKDDSNPFDELIEWPNELFRPAAVRSRHVADGADRIQALQNGTAPLEIRTYPQSVVECREEAESRLVHLQPENRSIVQAAMPQKSEPDSLYREVPPPSTPTQNDGKKLEDLREKPKPLKHKRKQKELETVLRRRSRPQKSASHAITKSKKNLVDQALATPSSTAAASHHLVRATQSDFFQAGPRYRKFAEVSEQLASVRQQERMPQHLTSLPHVDDKYSKTSPCSKDEGRNDPILSRAPAPTTTNSTGQSQSQSRTANSPQPSPSTWQKGEVSASQLKTEDRPADPYPESFKLKLMRVFFPTQAPGYRERTRADHSRSEEVAPTISDYSVHAQAQQPASSAFQETPLPKVEEKETADQDDHAHTVTSEMAESLETSLLEVSGPRFTMPALSKDEQEWMERDWENMCEDHSISTKLAPPTRSKSTNTQTAHPRFPTAQETPFPKIKDEQTANHGALTHPTTRATPQHVEISPPEEASSPWISSRQLSEQERERMEHERTTLLFNARNVAFPASSRDMAKDLAAKLRERLDLDRRRYPRRSERYRIRRRY
ncbi:hypothetical protein IWZ00DRAFT_544225 [Phyllosticta capitalensis]